MLETSLLVSAPTQRTCWTDASHWWATHAAAGVCCEVHLAHSPMPQLTDVQYLPHHRRVCVCAQVLLCKLIDVLDDAVPWDVGAKYDVNRGEEPQYIPRDAR